MYMRTHSIFFKNAISLAYFLIFIVTFSTFSRTLLSIIHMIVRRLEKASLRSPMIENKTRLYVCINKSLIVTDGFADFLSDI